MSPPSAPQVPGLEFGGGGDGTPAFELDELDDPDGLDRAALDESESFSSGSSGFSPCASLLDSVHRELVAFELCEM